MELARMVKNNLNFKQDNAEALESSAQLNKYMSSQHFIQLVNLQQLISAMDDFVGDKKNIKTSTLFEGISLCLNKTMNDIVHDRFDVGTQTALIQSSLQALGIKTSDVRIKSLYPRLIKLSIGIDRANPVLLNGDLKNQLERLFKESLRINISKVKNKSMQLDVSSSRNFKVEHGVAYLGKQGEKISGDSYICENFQNGKVILGISDGMGNGKMAQAESSQALKVLKNMMNFDIPVQDAVRVIAELKQESNDEERFFSLDLCVIDKEKGYAQFYKQAATTSYLVRGDTVRKIEMSGLPIGAVGAEGIDQMKIQLHEGDKIIMCTDGVIDAFGETELLEERILQNTTMDAHKLSQDLLFYTIEKCNGRIHDDMMVLAGEYKTIRPKNS